MGAKKLILAITEGDPKGADDWIWPVELKVSAFMSVYL